MPVAVEGKTGVKDLFTTIKHSPALMVTLLVGGVVVVYLLIKYGPGNSSPSTSTTLPSSLDSSGLAGSQLPGSYYLPQQDYVQTPNITLNPSVVVPMPASTATASATSSATIPSTDATAASPGATIPSTAPFFGAGIQVIQNTYKSGKPTTWNAYNSATKKSTNIASLFPSGTQFFGGTTGQAYYTLPGTNTRVPLSQVGMYGHQTH